MNLSRKMIAVIAMIALFAAITGVCLYQINYPDSEVTKLTWQRTGGFIGINEKLVIESGDSGTAQTTRRPG